MIISTYSKIGGQVVITVCNSILIGVNDLSQFGHLRYENMPRCDNNHSHGVMETGGKNFPLG